MKRTSSFPITSRKDLKFISQVIESEHREVYYLFFCIILYTGIDIQQARFLRVGDIHWERWFGVKKKKTRFGARARKRKKLLIPDNLINILYKRLRGRKPDEFLFGTENDPSKPLAVITLRSFLNNLSRKLGIKITATNLRFTFLYFHLLQYRDIKYIRENYRVRPDVMERMFHVMLRDSLLNVINKKNRETKYEEK